MSGIYDTLNDMQKEAVFCTEGPLLVLAGAGSGKTRVLTHRIAYLIEECGINPYNILAITFTNKAAKEMKDRVEKLIDYGADSVWVSTFHSMCVRILRRYIDRIGYGTNFTIYDTDDQKQLIKEIMKRLNIDTKLLKEKTVMGYISSAKDELITPQEMLVNAGVDYNKKRVAQVYMEYQAALKKSNALDFDDLIMKTVELFRSNPDVLNNYQERFRYILVDEYQDTNTVQFKLVSLMADKYRNLCVVGDDDQSIYKFRGANINNILNFERRFEGARVIKLEQNYRSTKAILNTANEVIRHNRYRKDKVLWTANEEGLPVRFKSYENGFEEASGVVDDIVLKKKSEDYGYSEFAILYRTNAQSRVFEEKLVKANVPYRIYGGVNFYQRREIKDILAYLKTIDNGQDDLAVKRIINVPKRGIGATTIQKVSDYALANMTSMYSALVNAKDIATIGKSYTKIEPFVNMISVFKSKAKFMSLTDFVEDVIKETEYLVYLKNEDEDEYEDRKANIDEFISKVASYEESTENPSLSDFLSEVALVAEIDAMDNSDVVTLMTLHSAKGLEFPIVYLVGMEDGLFPSYMSITSDDSTDIEEERRLCYVGITRAQKILTLSAAKMRMIRGEITYSKISRFVTEIPKELLATNTTAKKLATSMPQQQQNGMRKVLSNRTNYSLNDTVFDKPKTAEGLGYDEGDRVKHIKFGEGTVKNIVNGGRDYEVTVEFDTFGVKKMFASFAKLIKM